MKIRHPISLVIFMLPSLGLAFTSPGTQPPVELLDWHYHWGDIDPEMITELDEGGLRSFI